MASIFKKENSLSLLLIISKTKVEMNFKNGTMRLIISLLFVAILSGCISKKNTIDTKSWETINLDAYSAGANEKSLIQSILTSNASKQTMVELDQVKYKITQFNSITDTIKGKYDLKIEKKENYQIIKIVRL